MSFIGIITENKKEINVKNIISKNIEANVIIINEKNIDNIKNVKFETILICGINEKVFKKDEILKKIISNVKFLIINSDINRHLDILSNLNVVVISFGFNQKSSVTASSVNEDNILVCIQRNMKDINDKTIEPQEIRVEVENKSCNIHNIIGCICVLLIYGKKYIKI